MYQELAHDGPQAKSDRSCVFVYRCISLCQLRIVFTFHLIETQLGEEEHFVIWEDNMKFKFQCL